MSDLDLLFKQIPILERYRVTDFDCQELASLTNTNLRLSNEGLDLVLKLPNPKVADEVNRDSERHNHGIALEHGIALDILWCNQDGVTLSAWLPGSREITTQDLAEPSFLEEFMKRIVDLHQSAPEFEGCVSVEERLLHYSRRSDAFSDDHLADRLNRLMKLFYRLRQYDVEAVNSHNDLNLGNCLKAGDGSIWLIDWEYSAKTSPYWDLASLSNQMDWNEEQNGRLLEIYTRLNPSIGMLNLSLLECYQVMLVQLEQLWSQVHRHDTGFD